MARKAAPKHVEPEEESQEVPEEEPETEEDQDDETESPGKPMSKADACRALLAEGITENEDAVSAARSRFGIEIKPTDFSLYKSKEKKKQGEAAPKGKPGRKPKAASQAIEGYVAPPPQSNPPGEQPDLLAAMEAMKPLVASLGADKVKRIADLLG